MGAPSTILGMRKLATNWVLFSGPVVTLAFSPNLTYEPFDNIKLILLGICAGFAAGEFINFVKNVGFKSAKIQVYLALFLLIGLLIPLCFSGSPLSQQLYGAAGRSIGLLHYSFLICLLLGSSVIKSNEISRSFLKAIVLTGLFEATYGLVQYLNLDPINWDNEFKWIFGTFGNPNFLSAFLGMSICGSLFLLFANLGLIWKYLNILNVLLGVICISISTSIQGLVLVALGIFLLILVLAFKKSRLLGLSFGIFGSVAGVIAGLGLLQIGPLAKYLYQESTTFRGDYWRAGVEMAKDHLFVGVGLDSYGDYYRQYRDATAVTRRGLENYSDSAHNLFIDLTTNGGLILIVAYLVLIFAVLASILRDLKSIKSLEIEYFAIPSIWIAFQIQTLISINVSSVAIWGWIAGGLLLRNHSFSGEGYVDKNSNRNQRRGAKSKFGFSVLVIPSVFAIAAFPILYRDYQVAQAISSPSGPSLQSVTTSWPTSCFFMAKAEEAYTDAGDHKTSLLISLQSVERNSRCFNSFRHIYENPTSTSMQKNLALKKMHELDPLLP